MRGSSCGGGEVGSLLLTAPSGRDCRRLGPTGTGRGPILLSAACRGAGVNTRARKTWQEPRVCTVHPGEAGWGRRGWDSEKVRASGTSSSLRLSHLPPIRGQLGSPDLYTQGQARGSPTEGAADGSPKEKGNSSVPQNNLSEQRSLKAKGWEGKTERGPFGQGNRSKYLT